MADISRPAVSELEPFHFRYESFHYHTPYFGCAGFWNRFSAAQQTTEVSKERKSLCTLRPGIGLCDQCSLPKHPQTYVGYGIMLCADCLRGEPMPDFCKPMTLDQYIGDRRTLLEDI